MSKRKTKNKKNIKTKTKKVSKTNKAKNTKNVKKTSSKQIGFYFIIGAILILFLISIISTSFSNNQKDSNDEFIEVDKEDILQIEPLESEEEEGEIDAPYQINALSTLDDFLGKPSVILFVGTYCGHCNTLVPEFEKDIWSNYKDQANIWVQVINNDKFDVDKVVQGYNENLNYNDITNSECEYIPSFVVLDKNGDVLLQSCGSEKSLNDMANTLEENL